MTKTTIETNVAIRKEVQDIVEFADSTCRQLATDNENNKVADKFWTLLHFYVAEKSGAILPDQHNVSADKSDRENTRFIKTEDWENALGKGNELLELIEHLPEEAESFARGVTESVKGIMRTIEEREHVTDRQSTALDNMRSGVERWIK